MRGPPNKTSVYRSILCGPVAVTIAVCALPAAADAAPVRDRDRDGLSDWTERKRTRTSPTRRDTDRDRLSDWTEVRRTKTNPRRRDTDRDGLSDWTEVKRTKTDPRRPAAVLELQPAPLPLPAPMPTPADPGPGPGPADPGPVEPGPLPPPADTAPPETRIDAKPSDPVNDASASFEFSGLDPPGVAVTTFECRLDGGGWALCASPKQYTALADGRHEFEVRSVDAAANADPSPAAHGWEIDTAPPALAIESGPDGLTNDATPSFAFSAEPGASLACSIDRGTPSYGACSGADTHTPASPLGEGAQTFRLRATDAAGNEATATRPFLVDTAAPAAPELSATRPASPADDDTPELVGTAPVGTTVRLFSGGSCGGPPAATIDASELATGVEVEVADDSTTVFRATATTAAGNTSGCSEALTYVEDSTAPETEITAAPPPLTNDAAASFAFSSEDAGGAGVASFECRLDAGGWTSCASPRAYADVADGPHAFEVRAVDAAGNVDQSPALSEWRVDTTPPAPAIESGPDGLTNDATPSFAFSAPGATVQCSLDQGTPSFTACSGAGTHTPATALADGAWTFRVRATDAAGNEVLVSRGFTLDATPPETQLLAKPSALVNSATASFSFSGSDAGAGVAFLECRLDGGAFVACTSPIGHAGLGEGPHSFQVRAYDQAGNVDPSPPTHEWQIDLTPPSPQIEAGPEGLTKDSTPTFAFSAPGATFQCSLDKGTASFGACSSAGTHTPAAPLADGAWTFRLRATDAAGNEATATRGFQVDTAVPSAPTLSATAPASPANHNGPVLTGGAPAGTTVRLYAAAECSGSPLATIPAAELGAGIELSVADDTTTRLSATATSPALNTSACSAPLTYVEDSTAPTTQITSQPPLLTKATSASFSFAGADPGGSGVASFECRLDGGSFGPCTTPHEHTGLSEGGHSFAVRARDEAGNVDGTAAAHEWQIDTTPPALAIESGPDGLTNDSTPIFAFNAEPGATFRCSLDQGAASFGACSGADTHTPAAPLADGAWTFRLRATDAVGNEATATRGFQVDTAAPPAPTLTSTVPASPADHNAPRVLGTAPAGTTVRLFGGACSGAPLATIDPAELTAGVELAVADDSTTVFRATATTAAGNTSGCSEPLAYVEDSTAPATSIGTKPASPVNSTTATLSFSGSDPGGSGAASFECRLDDSAFGACTSPRELSGLSEGSHSFEVRAIDSAGNVDATPAAHTWTVDLSPPTVQVDTGPDGFTGDTTPTFGFSSEPDATFQCSLDKGVSSFGACSGAGSHTPAAGIGDGAWTFRVRALDAAGNHATATRPFDVDATAPNTQITAQPPALTNATAASFSFSGSDSGGSGVASFECRLDGGPFGACTSPRQLSALSEGGHSIQVRAIDAVGNVDGSPASHAWEVDLTPPAVQVESGPDGATGDTTPTVAFSAEPGTSLACSLDQGTPSFGACSGAGAHTPAAPLADGAWTFRVRATDAAGNEATATRTVEIDATAPETEIGAKPAPLVNTATASFSFSGSDAGSGVASLRCKLDNGPFVVCTSPHEYTGLAEGAHTFQVRAFDAAGNADGTPATHTWTVDLTPPVVQIESGPSGFTADTTPSFAFSAAGADLRCSLDQGTPSFGACTGADAHTPAAPLADGAWSFRVRATDAAGNEATATRSFNVDATAPETSIGAKPAVLVNATTASFTFNGGDPGGSGVASFQCRLDGGAFTTCTSPRQYSGLSEGPHTFQVRASDGAGNTDGSPATHTWTVDLTPPAVQIESGPGGLTNDSTPSFSFESEAGASFACSLDTDSPAFGPCAAAGSHTSATALADGPWTFRVRAADAAGNQATATRGFTLDATPPQTQLDGKPAPLVNSATATLSFSGADPGGSGVASFECRLDGAAFAACATPRELTGLSEGSHSFAVRAVDTAGNVDPTAATHTWTVDLTPPTPVIESGPDGPTGDSTPTFAFSAPDATFRCSLDQGTPSFGGCSGADTHTPAAPLADGAWTFRVQATDAAGNEATATRGFLLDTTLPPAPDLATVPPSPADENAPRLVGTAVAGTTVRLFAGGTCAGSPLATLTAAELASGIELAVADDSTTAFRATATTAAGNASGCSEPLTYVEDSTPPETAITAHPPALGNSTTASFSFTGEDGAGAGVASFQCRVGAQPFGPCASGAELTGIGHGTHTFEVRAVDAAGNVDATPATHTWEVDLAAPQVTIDAISKTLLRAMSSSNMTWHGNENGPFELRLGGADCGTGTPISTGTYSTQPAPRVATVNGAQLAEGANTVRLCLADAAGNRGAATTTLTRDSVSPQTEITLGPPALVNVATASLEFDGSDPGGSGVAAFRCRLDGGQFTPCASPRAYSELSEGLHVFEVRATDKAGNSDESTDEHEWRIDLTPPALAIEAGPDGLTNDGTPTFRYGSEPGATFRCSLDQGTPSFGACTGADNHTPAAPLADGAWTFRVQATDAAGNEATATRGFLLDSSAPSAPQLTATLPASPANHNGPRVFGTTAAEVTVRLYAGPCGGSPLAILTPAELAAGVEIVVADDTTTVFRATATTPEGDTSGCSEPLVYVEDSTAPQTTIAAAPPATTLSTSATFSLAASESGATLECSLDGGAFGACASPRSHAELAPGVHNFAVRATDAAGNVDQTPAETSWTIEPPPSEWPTACVAGTAQATTAAAVRDFVESGEDVCVTADVGDVDLGDLGARPVVVSTAGGSMGAVDLGSTTELTISRARIRSVTLRNSHRVRLLGNTIGGTPTERVSDQLIFMPDTNNDVSVEGNDIGWTIADDSGNTGYGCRCYGALNRLRFVGNRLHDLAADGFQGVGGVDVVIDRNEIGPVGRNPESDEHSDSIQITGNDANLRITNNWIHHQGYYDGEVTANAGSTYIHGDSDGTLTYENNLIETVQGRTEICGLGTGGVERSNITVRRNTWVDGGKAFNGFPGFEWDCDGGSGNVISRNIAIDPDGGLADNGYDAAYVAPNLFGLPSLVTLDADRNCTSANCNPADEEPIGYRKPSGVHW